MLQLPVLSNPFLSKLIVLFGLVGSRFRPRNFFSRTACCSAVGMRGLKLGRAFRLQFDLLRLGMVCAVNLLQTLLQDVRIDLSGRNIAVAQHQLD